MKIRDRKKFIIRISEIVIFLISFLLTPLAVNYANNFRGYEAVGGEYLIPFLGLAVVMIIETIYEESENYKGGKYAR